jgi:hypothetical protein
VHLARQRVQQAVRHLAQPGHAQPWLPAHPNPPRDH